MSNENGSGDSGDMAICLGYTEEEVEAAKKTYAEEAVIAARKQWESEPCKHNEYVELTTVTNTQNELLEKLGDIVKGQNEKLKNVEAECANLKEKEMAWTDSRRSLVSQLVKVKKDKALAETRFNECQKEVEQLNAQVLNLREEKERLKKTSEGNLNALTKRASALTAENAELKKQIRDLRNDNQKQLAKKVLDDLTAKNKLVSELRQEVETLKKNFNEEVQNKEAEKEELKNKGEMTSEKLKRAVDTIKKVQDQSKGLQNQVEVLTKEKSTLEGQIENERKLRSGEQNGSNGAEDSERLKKLAEGLEELALKSKEMDLQYNLENSAQKQVQILKQESLRNRLEWEFSEHKNKRLESEGLALEEKIQKLRDELTAQLVKFEALGQELVLEKEKVQKAVKEEKAFHKEIRRLNGALSKATADLASERKQRQISEANLVKLKEELAKQKVTARATENEKLRIPTNEGKPKSEGVFSRLKVDNGVPFIRPEETEMKRKGPPLSSPNPISRENKLMKMTPSANMGMEKEKLIMRRESSGRLSAEIVKNVSNPGNSTPDSQAKHGLLGPFPSPRIKFLEGNNSVAARCFHCGSPEHGSGNCPYENKPFLSRNRSGGGQIEVNFDLEGTQTRARKVTLRLPNTTR